MKLGKVLVVSMVMAMALAGWSGSSEAVALPSCDNIICAWDGEFTVMSLPFAGVSVQSSPGQISSGVVFYTGSDGGPVTTNFAGMDNAFPAVGGKSGGTSFNTQTTADPGGLNQFAGDAQSWDSTMAAFLTFLGGSTPQFFFNQNQLNSGTPADTVNCPGSTSAQDACLYGRITLVDLDNPANNLTLELESPTRLFSQGPELDGENNIVLPQDYVLAKGDVCLNAIGQQQACDGTEAFKENHNLGANEAAYVAFSPILNAALALCQQFGPNSPQCPWDSLSIDLFLAGLNNGFEQAFILTEAFVVPPPPGVPGPAPLLLLGGGFLGLAAWSGRRRK